MKHSCNPKVPAIFLNSCSEHPGHELVDLSPWESTAFAAEATSEYIGVKIFLGIPLRLCLLVLYEMPFGMATTWMTTAGASETLGLTRPMVRKLLGDGDLLSAGNAGRILLTDKESVRRHKSRARIPCRKWSEKTSWAALTFISGDAPAASTPIRGTA